MSTKQAFDGEVSTLYQRVFQQHYHPDGPWVKMVAEVKKALPTGTGEVLDLASGPGEPGASIAKEMPDAKVLLTDYSQDMVAKAAKHVEGLSNASAAQADAFNMPEVPSDSIDVVTCCYGYMFCPPEDRAKTFSETFRVLKPGGTLVATYWLSLEAMQLAQVVIAATFGPGAPPPAMNPLSLSEPGLVEGLLAKEGFVDAHYQDWTYPFDMDGGDQMAFEMSTLMLRDKLKALEAEGKGEKVEAGRKAFWAEVEKRGLKTPSGFKIPHNTFRMVVAKKPAAH